MLFPIVICKDSGREIFDVEILNPIFCSPTSLIALGQNPLVHMEECMQFRALHNRVGIKRIDAEEKPASGIIIPDTAKEKPPQGGNDANHSAPALAYQPKRLEYTP